MENASNQVRNQICKGALVDIVLKQDQKTGKLTRGHVRDILTNSPVHHRGIKVRLEGGLIGRIQNIIDDNDRVDYKNYDFEIEAEKTYGDTDEYIESVEKSKNYTKEDLDNIEKDAENIYNQFINNMEREVSDPIIQNLVVDWKNHITKNYYNCTNEILSNLGKMYVQDERFTNNLDKYKLGIAKYISDAIKYYCDNNQES